MKISPCCSTHLVKITEEQMRTRRHRLAFLCERKAGRDFLGIASFVREITKIHF